MQIDMYVYIVIVICYIYILLYYKNHMIIIYITSPGTTYNI